MMPVTDRSAASCELPLRVAACGPPRSYKPYLKQHTTSITRVTESMNGEGRTQDRQRLQIAEN